MLEDEPSRSIKVEHVEPLPQKGGTTNKYFILSITLITYGALQ